MSLSFAQVLMMTASWPVQRACRRLLEVARLGGAARSCFGVVRGAITNWERCRTGAVVAAPDDHLGSRPDARLAGPSRDRRWRQNRPAVRLRVIRRAGSDQRRVERVGLASPDDQLLAGPHHRCVVAERDRRGSDQAPPPVSQTLCSRHRVRRRRRLRGVGGDLMCVSGPPLKEDRGCGNDDEDRCPRPQGGGVAPRRPFAGSGRWLGSGSSGAGGAASTSSVTSRRIFSSRTSVIEHLPEVLSGSGQVPPHRSLRNAEQVGDRGRREIGPIRQDDDGARAHLAAARRRAPRVASPVHPDPPDRPLRPAGDGDGSRCGETCGPR